MLLIILLLSIVVVEGIARIILYSAYNRKFDASLIQPNKYNHSDGLKPNRSGIVWGKNFSTDQYGGRNTGTSAKARKKKFLFIGDSVTEGVGVEDEQTFSSIAAKQLPEFDVVNLSLIGYSTQDYVNVLSAVLSSDSAIELVNLFYCLNDVYAGAANAELPVMAKQNFWATCSHWLQENISIYKLLKLWYFRNADNYYRYDASFYESSSPYFQKAMQQLSVCDSLCKEKNIFFNVILLPYRSQLGNTYDTATTPQKFVRTYFEQHEISYNDALDFFREEENPAALYLFADEIHLSEKGHQKMASFLVE